MPSFTNGIAVSTFLLLLGRLNAFSAEVAYIWKPSGPAHVRQQAETATKFYGLEIGVTPVTGDVDGAAVVKTIGDASTLAVILDAESLPYLDQKKVFAAMRNGGRSIPLMIAGITEHTEAALLRQWSHGTITKCLKSPIKKGSSFIIGRQNQITQQLGGSKLPLNRDEISYLTFKSLDSPWLMAASSDGADLPVFASIMNNGQEMFFATAFLPDPTPATPDPYRQPAVFATLAPQIMFLRYAAGERAWHSLSTYANLTIDDVWLREPYGHVYHEQLLREMQKHNFHTTLAFVPWNFDRSQLNVALLFRTHPQRFSICVHGNNHDHQEFGPYETHPLADQVSNIKQGLARMNKFSQLTSIPYDPVMVFPHEISPERTLTELKRYNYLATTNSHNVPSDASAPSNSEFALRPTELSFSNFASIRRYSAEASIPPAQLAIDAFLGNPMLFYVHQNFFEPGMSAFNKIADTVNQLQPDTQWRGLGYIARHLYLEKQRGDGNYDIRLYTRSIQLINTHQRDATFFVEKEEDFAIPVSVYVDGQPYTHERTGTRLRLQLTVSKGMSRSIDIQYANDLNLAAADISKTSLRIGAIRRLSDFRDNVVSRTDLGRRFARVYAENRSTWNRSVETSAVLLALGLAFLHVRKKLSGMFYR